MAHPAPSRLALFYLISRSFRVACAMREGDRNTAREHSPATADNRLLDGRRAGSSTRRGADEPGIAAAQAR
jgi:hypothetical protein